MPTRLDKSKPFGECSGIEAAHYYQAGHFFDIHGNETSESGQPLGVGEVKMPKAREAKSLAKARDKDADGTPTPAAKKKTKNPSAALAEWRELRAKSKALGGPISNKKACLEFLAGK